MKRNRSLFLDLLICFIIISLPMQAEIISKSTNPDSFGAKGDGIADDAPAFNQCIALKCPIELTKGKKYLLKSKISQIDGESFILNGNGAQVVISEEYPLDKYTEIFRFKGEGVYRKLMAVTNLSITCLLGQKFKKIDEVGDTYVFYVPDCEMVQMKSVHFVCEKLYNNVSFLVMNGGNLDMDKCNIILNTQSKQGGILWMMDKYRKECSISISNSFFEHDTKDEAMCFSLSSIKYPPMAMMKVRVKNCTYVSKGNVQSSGFIISYNHADSSYMNAEIVFKRCAFANNGRFARKVISYQCGNNKGVNYGIYKSLFVDCDFHYWCNEQSKGGLLGLLTVDNSIPMDNILYEFRKCKFDLKGVQLFVGDKYWKGTFTLKSCGSNVEELLKNESDSVNIRIKN